MEIDLAERLDGAPELRLASYTYREVFGHPAAGVWRVPGTVTLLADGRRRLSVAVRWGAIIAAALRDDDIIEPLRMSRPDEQTRVTVAKATAGAGPAWAAEGLRSARAGAALLVNTDLPDGSGAGAAQATQAAIRLALCDLTPDTSPRGEPGQYEPGQYEPGQYEPGMALLDGRLLPFDPVAAGLRLVIIDTRVRGVPQPPLAESSPVDEAAAALDAGDIEALGPMLTAAHRRLEPDEVQEVAVSAALSAGALGARMITDGPGRPALALLPASRLAAVRTAVSGALQARGSRPARFLTIAPARGAYRAAGGA
jgi:galactokinase